MRSRASWSIVVARTRGARERAQLAAAWGGGGAKSSLLSAKTLCHSHLSPSPPLSPSAPALHSPRGRPSPSHSRYCWVTAKSGSSRAAARAARSAKALLLVGCGLRERAGCLLIDEVLGRSAEEAGNELERPSQQSPQPPRPAPPAASTPRTAPAWLRHPCSGSSHAERGLRNSAEQCRFRAASASACRVAAPSTAIERQRGDGRSGDRGCCCGGDRACLHGAPPRCASRCACPCRSPPDRGTRRRRGG